MGQFLVQFKDIWPIGTHPIELSPHPYFIVALLHTTQTAHLRAIERFTDCCTLAKIRTPSPTKDSH